MLGREMVLQRLRESVLRDAFIVKSRTGAGGQ
jgi:hypothetical protein